MTQRNLRKSPCVAARQADPEGLAALGTSNSHAGSDVRRRLTSWSRRSRNSSRRASATASKRAEERYRNGLREDVGAKIGDRFQPCDLGHRLRIRAYPSQAQAAPDQFAYDLVRNYSIMDET